MATKLQKTTLCLLLFFVTTSYSFFLQSRDIKRMLRFLPKVFDVDNNQGTRPAPFPGRDSEYHYHDYYDRQDYVRENSKNTDRNLKGKNGGYDHKQLYSNNPNKPIHHHLLHQDCDHPDHYTNQDRYAPVHYTRHHQKYPEDRVEQHYNKKHTKSRNSEEMRDYNVQNSKRYYNPKKIQNEREYEDALYEKNKKTLNYNKDYITGILVNIPKIKNNGDDEDSYYNEDKQESVYLEHLLKTDDEAGHRPEDSFAY